MKEYETVQKPSFMVMGITCKTSNAPDAGPRDIPMLWGRFYSEDILRKIPHVASKEVFAIYCDYEGDHTKPYSVLIGAPVTLVDAIPEGLVVKKIKGGTYASFKAVGNHPQALIETWGEIWKTNLQRTYVADFEIYGPKFTTQPQEVEVLIGINP